MKLKIRGKWYQICDEGIQDIVIDGLTFRFEHKEIRSIDDDKEFLRPFTINIVEKAWIHICHLHGKFSELPEHYNDYISTELEKIAQKQIDDFEEYRCICRGRLKGCME